MQTRSSPRRSPYEPSNDYTARRQAPIPHGYVAVRRARSAPTHVVKAESFGAVAKALIADRATTVCGMRIGERWGLVPRDGQTVQCHTCRSNMEGR